MDETVFFNRGNILASSFDSKDLYTQEQIFDGKNIGTNQFVILKHKEDGAFILVDKIHEADFLKSNQYEVFDEINVAD